MKPSTPTTPDAGSPSAVSLGQMESEGSLDVLKGSWKEDSSRDVRHQCELAIDRITKKQGATEVQLAAFRNLNPKDFETV